MGVCGQKQFLIVFPKCYGCNTFAIIQGGQGWLVIMQAMVLWCEQAGLYPGASWAFLYQLVCWCNLSPGIWHGLSPLTRQIPIVYAQGFSQWLALCFVSPKPVKYNLKGLQHVCQISGFQVEKTKVAWKVTALQLLLSTGARAILFQFKNYMGGSRDISVEPLA